MSADSKQAIHVVLLKWMEDASEEAIDAAESALRGLQDAVPGILSLSCGPNFSDRSQGYQFGLVVVFENRASLDAYLPQPAHRAVVEKYLQPIRADSLVVDFEM